MMEVLVAGVTMLVVGFGAGFAVGVSLASNRALVLTRAGGGPPLPPGVPLPEPPLRYVHGPLPPGVSRPPITTRDPGVDIHP